jgi:hypothetical protein
LEFDVIEATLAQLKWTQDEVLPQLRALGVKIAIDGFGSEYSSFDYIREYRVNHLKIARSFIDKSTMDTDCAATIRAIVSFARDIGIAVIAQGVETAQQSALLSQTDSATQAQGFHFSKPVDPTRATELLRQGFVAKSGSLIEDREEPVSKRRDQAGGTALRYGRPRNVIRCGGTLARPSLLNVVRVSLLRRFVHEDIHCTRSCRACLHGRICSAGASGSAGVD